MKEPGYDRWKFVQHVPFDGNLEDDFTGTSLNLSFTGYKQPLFTGEHGLRDPEIYFLQSVVQVYDKGSWVADIDILKAFASAEKITKVKKKFLIRHTEVGKVFELATKTMDVNKEFGALRQPKRLAGPGCTHSGDGMDDCSGLGTIKTIDCWDEIIDEPDGISIARAKGNRLARLALSVVAFQKKKRIVIADEPVCWDCVRALGFEPGSDAIIIC